MNYELICFFNASKDIIFNFVLSKIGDKIQKVYSLFM